jgi:hypothetical protein
MTVEGIGTIRNRVVRDFEAVPPVQQVRRRPPRAPRAPQLARNGSVSPVRSTTVERSSIDPAGYTI